jgi:hypothetical protein
MSASDACSWWIISSPEDLQYGRLAHCESEGMFDMVFYSRMFRVGLFLMLAAFAHAQDTCTLNRSLRAGGARPLSSINAIVLHHTAIASLGNSLATLRIRGLSYHYLIDRDGTIVRAVPPQRVAFHAAGANRGSIGVSFVGGNDSSWTPTAAQWKAAETLVGRLVRKYKTIRYVMGHGDVRDTNAGEPFNVSFDRMIADVRTATRVELYHPGSEEEPLKEFRRAALYLLEHPRTSAGTTLGRTHRFEIMTCSEGRVRRVPVSFKR